MKNKRLIIYSAVAIIFSATACKKYLDVSTNASLVVISKLQDLQGLLENHNAVSYSDAIYGEASADNFFITDADYASKTEQERNMYTWANGNIFNNGFTDWSYAYDNVYRANTILDHIDKIPANTGSAAEFDNVRGQAYFLRGKSFFQLAVLFSPAYDQGSSDKDLGIPLRLTSSVSENIQRSSVKATYDQILKDLKTSIPLLPTTPVHVVRPSKTAALGLIARTYLSMRMYDSCAKYTDKALQLKDNLVAFSTLRTTGASSFSPEFSFAEIIYYSRLRFLFNDVAKVNPTLYQSYADNDLRKKIFFSGAGPYTFKGAYTGNTNYFGGIAVNELYLMRAECYARAGEKQKALDDLNSLLAKRIDPASFVPVTANDSQEALTKILTERRKELIFSGVRWMDIKRLNKEGANIILTRVIGDKTYTLPPNDPRYALAIPENVIALSGIQQNPRN